LIIDLFLFFDLSKMEAYGEITCVQNAELVVDGGALKPRIDRALDTMYRLLKEVIDEKLAETTFDVKTRAQRERDQRSFDEARDVLMKGNFVLLTRLLRVAGEAPTRWAWTFQRSNGMRSDVPPLPVDVSSETTEIGDATFERETPVTADLFAERVERLDDNASNTKKEEEEKLPIIVLPRQSLDAPMFVERLSPDDAAAYSLFFQQSPLFSPTTTTSSLDTTASWLLTQSPDSVKRYWKEAFEFFERMRKSLDAIFDFQRALALRVRRSDGSMTGTWRLYRRKPNTANSGARWVLALTSDVWVQDVDEHYVRCEHSLRFPVGVNPLLRHGFDRAAYRITRHAIATTRGEELAWRGLVRRVHQYGIKKVQLQKEEGTPLSNPSVFVVDPRLLDVREARSMIRVLSRNAIWLRARELAVVRLADMNMVLLRRRRLETPSSSSPETTAAWATFTEKRNRMRALLEREHRRMENEQFQRSATFSVGTGERLLEKFRGIFLRPHALSALIDAAVWIHPFFKERHGEQFLQRLVEELENRDTFDADEDDDDHENRREQFFVDVDLNFAQYLIEYHRLNIVGAASGNNQETMRKKQLERFEEARAVYGHLAMGTVNPATAEEFLQRIEDVVRSPSRVAPGLGPASKEIYAVFQSSLVPFFSLFSSYELRGLQPPRPDTRDLSDPRVRFAASFSDVLASHWRTPVDVDNEPEQWSTVRNIVVERLFERPSVEFSFRLLLLGPTMTATDELAERAVQEVRFQSARMLRERDEKRWLLAGEGAPSIEELLREVAADAETFRASLQKEEAESQHAGERVFWRALRLEYDSVYVGDRLHKGIESVYTSVTILQRNNNTTSGPEVSMDEYFFNDKTEKIEFPECEPTARELGNRVVLPFLSLMDAGTYEVEQWNNRQEKFVLRARISLSVLPQRVLDVRRTIMVKNDETVWQTLKREMQPYVTNVIVVELSVLRSRFGDITRHLLRKSFNANIAGALQWRFSPGRDVESLYAEEERASHTDAPSCDPAALQERYRLHANFVQRWNAPETEEPLLFPVENFLTVADGSYWLIESRQNLVAIFSVFIPSIQKHSLDSVVDGATVVLRDDRPLNPRPDTFALESTEWWFRRPSTAFIRETPWTKIFTVSSSSSPSDAKSLTLDRVDWRHSGEYAMVVNFVDTTLMALPQLQERARVTKTIEFNLNVRSTATTANAKTKKMRCARCNRMLEEKEFADQVCEWNVVAALKRRSRGRMFVMRQIDAYAKYLTKNTNVPMFVVASSKFTQNSSVDDASGYSKSTVVETACLFLDKLRALELLVMRLLGSLPEISFDMMKVTRREYEDHWKDLLLRESSSPLLPEENRVRIRNFLNDFFTPLNTSATTTCSSPPSLDAQETSTWRGRHSAWNPYPDVLDVAATMDPDAVEQHNSRLLWSRPYVQTLRGFALVPHAVKKSRCQSTFDDVFVPPFRRLPRRCITGSVPVYGQTALTSMPPPMSGEEDEDMTRSHHATYAQLERERSQNCFAGVRAMFPWQNLIDFLVLYDGNNDSPVVISKFGVSWPNNKAAFVSSVFVERTGNITPQFVSETIDAFMAGQWRNHRQPLEFTTEESRVLHDVRKSVLQMYREHFARAPFTGGGGGGGGAVGGTTAKTKQSGDFVGANDLPAFRVWVPDEACTSDVDMASPTVTHQTSAASRVTAMVRDGTGDETSRRLAQIAKAVWRLRFYVMTSTLDAPCEPPLSIASVVSFSGSASDKDQTTASTTLRKLLMGELRRMRVDTRDLRKSMHRPVQTYDTHLQRANRAWNALDQLLKTTSETMAINRRYLVDSLTERGDEHNIRLFTQVVEKTRAARQTVVNELTAWRESLQVVQNDMDALQWHVKQQHPPTRPLPTLTAWLSRLRQRLRVLNDTASQLITEHLHSVDGDRALIGTMIEQFFGTESSLAQRCASIAMRFAEERDRRLGEAYDTVASRVSTNIYGGAVGKLFRETARVLHVSNELETRYLNPNCDGGTTTAMVAKRYDPSLLQDMVNVLATTVPEALQQQQQQHNNGGGGGGGGNQNGEDFGRVHRAMAITRHSKNCTDPRSLNHTVTLFAKEVFSQLERVQNATRCLALHVDPILAVLNRPPLPPTQPPSKIVVEPKLVDTSSTGSNGVVVVDLVETVLPSKFIEALQQWQASIGKEKDNNIQLHADRIVNDVVTLQKLARRLDCENVNEWFAAETIETGVGPRLARAAALVRRVCAAVTENEDCSAVVGGAVDHVATDDSDASFSVIGNVSAAIATTTNIGNPARHNIETLSRRLSVAVQKTKFYWHLDHTLQRLFEAFSAVSTKSNAAVLECVRWYRRYVAAGGHRSLFLTSAAGKDSAMMEEFLEQISSNVHNNVLASTDESSAMVEAVKRLWARSFLVDVFHSVHQLQSRVDNNNSATVSPLQRRVYEQCVAASVLSVLENVSTSSPLLEDYERELLRFIDQRRTAILGRVFSSVLVDVMRTGGIVPTIDDALLKGFSNASTQSEYVRVALAELVFRKNPAKLARWNAFTPMSSKKAAVHLFETTNNNSVGSEWNVMRQSIVAAEKKIRSLAQRISLYATGRTCDVVPTADRDGDDGLAVLPVGRLPSATIALTGSANRNDVDRAMALIMTEISHDVLLVGKHSVGKKYEKKTTTTPRVWMARAHFDTSGRVTSKLFWGDDATSTALSRDALGDGGMESVSIEAFLSWLRNAVTPRSFDKASVLFRVRGVAARCIRDAGESATDAPSTQPVEEETVPVVDVAMTQQQRDDSALLAITENRKQRWATMRAEFLRENQKN
jgi:hypothetical protein